MNLVDVSQRAIPLREIADLMQWRYIAVHGIKAFAQDQLRSVRCCRAKQLLEIKLLERILAGWRKHETA